MVKQIVCVEGMHCESCDILVKKQLEKDTNVNVISTDHTTQKVTLESKSLISLERLNKHLKPFGYSVTNASETCEYTEPLVKKITDASVIAMMLLLLFFMGQHLNIIPSFELAGQVSLITILIIGLVASVSTCMATTGAVFLTTIGKKLSSSSSEKIIRSTVSFNAGRIGMYTLFGAINGYVGQFLTQQTQFATTTNIVIGLLLLFIGLDMLGILSFKRLIPFDFGKRIFIPLEAQLSKRPTKTAFGLGAITYFLPCGFTQSVQLYALSVADPFMSAVIMLVFVLGTTPVLVGLAFSSSLIKTSLYPLFMKVVAVFVCLVGFSYVLSYLSLYGLYPFNVFFAERAVATEQISEYQYTDLDGTQVLRMIVNTNGYEPKSFIVKKDVPVRWEVEGKDVVGCQALLNAPKAGITKVLTQGLNIFEFTPNEQGIIGFSCSNGSKGGEIIVEG